MLSYTIAILLFFYKLQNKSCFHKQGHTPFLKFSFMYVLRFKTVSGVTS